MKIDYLGNKSPPQQYIHHIKRLRLKIVWIFISLIDSHWREKKKQHIVSILSIHLVRIVLKFHQTDIRRHLHSFRSQHRIHSIVSSKAKSQVLSTAISLLNSFVCWPIVIEIFFTVKFSIFVYDQVSVCVCKCDILAFIGVFLLLLLL